MSEPKDIEAVTTRTIKDKIVSFGKYKDKKKYFSEIIKEDAEYRNEFVSEYKDMRDFYNYVIQSDIYQSYIQGQKEERRKQKTLEKKAIVNKTKEEKKYETNILKQVKKIKKCSSPKKTDLDTFEPTHGLPE